MCTLRKTALPLDPDDHRGLISRAIQVGSAQEPVPAKVWATRQRSMTASGTLAGMQAVA